MPVMVYMHQYPGTLRGPDKEESVGSSFRRGFLVLLATIVGGAVIIGMSGSGAFDPPRRRMPAEYDDERQD